ncbi:MAG TPA: helix-turn-helix domain-containing protein [Caldithrix abyssi]|uniref:Helix-turn-helix domain-containing protein n=1 Tax=Caldithrix abyssi TaxID=187145 RepID=A0A7V5LJ08_CALAY|nr:helix-turn-helix domain-containing protein [Caldithrix abyssi]
MIPKVPILKNRIRKVPKQFSWVDHRLVRDRYIEKLSHSAAALYLFLITVSDAKGLSYYGNESIMKCLCMGQSTLQNARSNLIQNGMIAWQKPLYQVLNLDIGDPAKRSCMDSPLSLGSILKTAVEETA